MRKEMYLGKIAIDKSMNFSVRIVNLCKLLRDEKKEFVMSNQLLRCGTSIGANLHEAEYAQSKMDFIHKNSISLKECAEAEYWIELLYRTDYINKQAYESIKTDATELIKILTSIVKTSKNCVSNST
jgi:four helix bundle protein